MKKIFFFNRVKELFKFYNLKEKNIFHNIHNKLKGKRVKRKDKKAENVIMKNYIINNNYIVKIIIKSIIILDLLYRTKSYLYDSYFFQYSKITLKIRGNSENAILNYNFKGINYLKEVHINGNKKNEIAYRYYFNQEDNFVELIWNNNIDSTENMFYECTSITKINLSAFDNSLVTSMENMFEGCSSLTSLDLSNFNTSLVNNMIFMFSRCSLLTSLDLSDFDTSSVIRMDSMFSHCISLSSLNLSNFDTSSLISADSMFYGCINLEYINLYKFNERKIRKNMFENIKNILVICIKSTINNLLNNTISDIIYNKTNSNIEDKKHFIIDCSKDWKTKQKRIININDNTCKKVPLYTKCEDNCYPKENDPKNLGNFINCYNKPEGYYLDNNLYKKCYKTCKTCDREGNYIYHNCITCHQNISIVIPENNLKNCRKNCSYYYYFDNQNNFQCTMNLSCPDAYPLLIKNRNECIEYLSFESLKRQLQNNGNITLNTKTEENKYYDNIIKNIEENFTSENYDSSNIDNGKDDVIKEGKITITFTSSQNQKNNINYNMTTIDLGECETLLRNEYNISINETLYMKKIDIVQEGMKTTKVEYDVYCKLFGAKLIKLNLTVCENSKISIYTPFEIKENIDKYNSSSGYYNDICYTTTSEDGTDIPLKDRQKNFIDGDKIVCQEDCEFADYNSNISRAQCLCNVKETPQSIADMNINKDKIYDNFINFKNIANFDFLVCYKILFCKKGLIYNIGSHISIAIIFFHIITLFIFYINQYDSLKNKIKNIRIYVHRKIRKENIITVNDLTNYMPTSHRKFKKKSKKHKRKKKFKNSHLEKLLKDLKDEEYNTLPYNLALLYDKRTYCEFYVSLLKTQHNFVSSFINNNDYNSKIIKIDLFFIGFAIEYSVNAIFYDDDTMHKIYKSSGKFEMKTQLPIMIYSMLISAILHQPINFFGLSNDDIITFKQGQTKRNFIQRIINLEKKLSIKFIFFFIIGFLLLVFLWYYISMFCAIYKNTQIHLICDTLLSYGISFLFPFVFYLLPGIFRKIALSGKKYKRKLLYDFSKFLNYLEFI